MENPERYFLPYNKKLIPLARELRKNMTAAEKKFWYCLSRNKQFEQHKFERQKPIGNFIVDFYCAKLKLVIELDGNSHDNTSEKDVERTHQLESLDLRVIRFTNEDVLKNINGVYLQLITLFGDSCPPYKGGIKGGLEL